ncbi:MAG: PAS domain-containing protein [Deltaproteobacteria bacterium]|nr:PAS domain-containing protein [Deltaproteobacteria bacterium]
MINNLSLEQMEAILDALPIEFIFIDDRERLVYANKEEKRSSPASAAVMGKDIRGCHQPQSLSLMEQFVSNLKSGVKDEENFWLLFPDRKILNRFIAVRDKSGKYLGMIEYLFDFKAVEELADAKKDAHVRDYSKQPSDGEPTG